MNNKNKKAVEILMRAIFGRAKDKPVTEYIIIETFAGKAELKDVLADLIYTAYRRQSG